MWRYTAKPVMLGILDARAGCESNNFMDKAGFKAPVIFAEQA